MMNKDTEQALMMAFEKFFMRESELVMATLQSTRTDIKDSVYELVEEQDKCKEELSKATDGKYDCGRRKKGE